MAQVVNNTDELTFILTTYGLNRIAQVKNNSTDTLNLSKIKIGSGDNNSYYTPAESQTALKGPIDGGSFYILDTDLLEDNVTVSFHTVISEEYGGFDIREVGLYETVDDVDYLFAVGTQQPFVKPSANLEYFITLDYYIFLKSTNLAQVYDKIILNPDNQMATEQDFEDLMSTVLFTQGTLSNQIASNSRQIGMDKSSLVYKMVKENKEAYGYMTLYNDYSDLLGYVDKSNVYGYWLFDYPRRTGMIGSITDISSNAHNLSTNNPINVYDKEYYGFQSMLDFSSPNYYYLKQPLSLDLVDASGNDVSFTMIFLVNSKASDGNTAKRTLLARSNYASGNNIFEVSELSNNSLEIKLFSNSTNYVTYTSGIGSIPNGAHSIIFSYNKDESELSNRITLYISGKKVGLSCDITGTYTHMNTSLSTIYGWKCTPYKTVYADRSVTPIGHLYTETGSPQPTVGSPWVLSNDGIVTYNGEGTSYDSSVITQTDRLYAWSGTDSILGTHIIYTKVSSLSALTDKLYTSNYVEYDGSTVVGETLYKWKATDTSSTEHIIYTKSSTIDSLVTPLFDANGVSYIVGTVTGASGHTGYFSIVLDGSTYKIKWTSEDETESIYLASDGSVTPPPDGYFNLEQSGSNFQIRWTSTDSSITGSMVLSYNSSLDILPRNIYAWKYYYADEKVWANSSTTPTILFDSDGNIYSGINWSIPSGSSIPICSIYGSTFNGSYSSTDNKSVTYLEATSYIINTSGNRDNLVNSEVGIVSVIKEKITEDQIRNMSLIYEATLGNNPCVSLY